MTDQEIKALDDEEMLFLQLTVSTKQNEFDAYDVEQKLRAAFKEIKCTSCKNLAEKYSKKTSKTLCSKHSKNKNGVRVLEAYWQEIIDKISKVEENLTKAQSVYKYFKLLPISKSHEQTGVYVEKFWTSIQTAKSEIIQCAEKCQAKPTFSTFNFVDTKMKIIESVTDELHQLVG